MRNTATASRASASVLPFVPFGGMQAYLAKVAQVPSFEEAPTRYTLEVSVGKGSDYERLFATDSLSLAEHMWEQMSARHGQRARFKADGQVIDRK